MQRIMLAAAVMIILLNSCSKNNHPPEAIALLPDRTVYFKVFVDPAQIRDFERINASIKLSVLKTTFSAVQSEIVWDTLISMKSLKAYPGPKEALILSAKTGVVDPAREVLSLGYQKFYMVDQKLETSSHQEPMPGSMVDKTIEVVL